MLNHSRKSAVVQMFSILMVGMGTLCSGHSCHASTINKKQERACSCPRKNGRIKELAVFLSWWHVK